MPAIPFTTNISACILSLIIHVVNDDNDIFICIQYTRIHYHILIVGLMLSFTVLPLYPLNTMEYNLWMFDSSFQSIKPTLIISLFEYIFKQTCYLWWPRKQYNHQTSLRTTHQMWKVNMLTIDAFDTFIYNSLWKIKSPRIEFSWKKYHWQIR